MVTVKKRRKKRCNRFFDRVEGAEKRPGVWARRRGESISANLFARSV